MANSLTNMLDFSKANHRKFILDQNSGTVVSH